MKRTYKYLAIVFLIALLLFGWFLRYSKIVGTVYGAETDQIIIDDIVYIRTTSEECPYNSSDKGLHIGKGAWLDGTPVLDLYRIKGDTAFNYIYVRYEWVGEIYMRENMIVE